MTIKKRVLSLTSVVLLTFMTSCGGGSSSNVVESGTYEGKVDKVKPDELEIYVNYKDKELELYFTDSTKLMKGGESVDFSNLKKGQKVEVKVEKMGKKLNPLKVKILH